MHEQLCPPEGQGRPFVEMVGMVGMVGSLVDQADHWSVEGWSVSTPPLCIERGVPTIRSTKHKEMTVIRDYLNGADLSTIITRDYPDQDLFSSSPLAITP